ncbi:MAG: uncharacterized protein PWQ96_1014 [Clostridia bacterium]|nr:phosphohydrolase [Clostridiales bacterium]MDK2985372.1 uncharacterized protein [Clostridia bacterium]
MNIYAMADLHLSFTEKFQIDNLESTKLSKPMDIFGDKWDNHYLKIWRNWSATVKEDDIVLVPGDISWALKLEEALFDLEFIERLPGKKILGKGNHDYWWQSLKKISEVTSDRIDILQNNCLPLNDEVVLCGTRGWLSPNDIQFEEHNEKLYKRELIRLENSLKKAPAGKKILVMLHYPPVNDKHERSGFIELMESYGVHTCIYGHLHDGSIRMRIEGDKWGINFQLVSADYLDFKPKLIKI